MTSKAHNFEDKVRTKDVLIDQQLNFNALLLSDQTHTGLVNCGFQVPSPIQLKAIPIGRCGFDLIVKSKSGTGKTAVFVIIALELVHVKKDAVQVLILAPTREVAVQIEDVLKSIGSAFKDLNIQSFIGGLPIDQDIKKLEKCHIAVGAPGRVRHLIELGALKIKSVKLFILDEADKLVGSEMKADIDYILKKLPVTKQIVTSSATYSDNTFTYLNNLMSGPTVVEPDTDTPLLLGLKQFVTVVKSNLNVVHQLNIKNEELNRLLSQITFSQCVVFTNYQCRAESISNTLNRKGWSTMYISAAQSQPERLKVINLFKEGNCRLLLSTDVTARGIDAANIDLVINYDVPLEASTYLHRIGRAGRFGSHGISITIAANGKDLNAYCAILGEIGGRNIFVPQLPVDINLPNDLWNADTSSFELIQGIVTGDSKPTDRHNIINSINDLKVQRKNVRKEKLDVNETADGNECITVRNDSKKDQKDFCTIADENIGKGDQLGLLNEDTDTNMSQTIETLLKTNRLKEESLKTEVTPQNALSLLKNLASGQDVECGISPENVENFHSIDESQYTKNEQNMLNQNVHTDMSQAINVLLETSRVKEEAFKTEVIPQNALGLLKNLASAQEIPECGSSQENVNPERQLLVDVLADLSSSKKRKRVPENVTRNTEIEEKSNQNDIICKNLALLNATKLLCESYDSTKISSEASSVFDNYLEIMNENRCKEITTGCAKTDILNSVADGEVDNILNNSPEIALKANDDETQPEKLYDDELEDIFKLSYDYAINSEKMHWLNALGKDLEEKMSIVEDAPDNQPELACNPEVPDFLFEIPKRKKYRSRKKKTFKDFTQKNKKYGGDQSDQSDQSMEACLSQGSQTNPNNVTSSVYPEYLCPGNQHFKACFDHCSEELMQKLQTFEDVKSFDEWFKNWQWHVQEVREYIHQNIYVREMSPYACDKHVE